MPIDDLILSIILSLSFICTVQAPGIGVDSGEKSF